MVAACPDRLVVFRVVAQPTMCTSHGCLLPYGANRIQASELSFLVWEPLGEMGR